MHAVNNTAGPDGLTPTLFLFRTVPRIATEQPHQLSEICFILQITAPTKFMVRYGRSRRLNILNFE